MDNVQMFNVLRKDMSKDFQDRIPEATKTNLGKIAEAVVNYPTHRNEFIETLTNKVTKTIFFNRVWKNKFKLFHKGDMPFGESIESIYVDLIKAKSFNENFGDNEVESLVKKEKTNVKVEYYSQNYKHKYKTTISKQQLKQAFYSENGLQNLVNIMVSNPTNSAEYDEFLLLKGALANAKYVDVEAVKPVDLQTSKKLTKQIRSYVTKLGFLSEDYNVGKVKTFSNPDDLMLIIDPDTKAELDVELLAQAFNMSKAEMSARIIEIDKFDDDTTVALLVDKEFIQFWTTLVDSGSFANPDGLYYNMFYHRWGIIAQCSFVNCLRFTTSPALEMSEKEVKKEEKKEE